MHLLAKLCSAALHRCWEAALVERAAHPAIAIFCSHSASHFLAAVTHNLHRRLLQLYLSTPAVLSAPERIPVPALWLRTICQPTITQAFRQQSLLPALLLIVVTCDSQITCCTAQPDSPAAHYSQGVGAASSKRKLTAALPACMVHTHTLMMTMTMTTSPQALRAAAGLGLLPNRLQRESILPHSHLRPHRLLPPGKQHHTTSNSTPTATNSSNSSSSSTLVPTSSHTRGQTATSPAWAAQTCRLHHHSRLMCPSEVPDSSSAHCLAAWQQHNNSSSSNSSATGGRNRAAQALQHQYSPTMVITTTLMVSTAPPSPAASAGEAATNSRPAAARAAAATTSEPAASLAAHQAPASSSNKGVPAQGTAPPQAAQRPAATAAPSLLPQPPQPPARH